MTLTSRLALAPVLLLLAACGSAGAAGNASDAGTVQVALNAQNIQFDPPLITAKPGQKVAVTLSNHDGFKHNFSITELGVNQDIDPGKTLTFLFTTKGSSDVAFFCEYHKAKGMVGTLNLSGVAPSPVPSPSGSGPSPAAPSSPYSAY